MPRGRSDVGHDESVTSAELDALAELGKEGDWTVDGTSVHVTNLDKVLFEGRDGEPPITKRELIAYFARMANVMLPYLEQRPVNSHRYPDGRRANGIWQKSVPNHAPEWITRWHNDEADAGETQWYAVVDSVATLVWMANYAAVELHPWTSRLPNVHEPTWALIDIDPGRHTTWEEVLLLARLFRTALEHVDLEARPKVTGQRGIHILVPLRSGYSFDDTRRWVEELSRAVGAVVPELVSWKWNKNERGGRARLDYTQNAINKTIVAPYCTRPSAGVPVSVPIEWDELDDPMLTPDRWTIRNVDERIRRAGDPLAAVRNVEQDLPTL